MRAKKFAETFIFYIGLIVLWQLLYTIFCNRLQLIKPYAIPNPKGVLDCILFLISNGTLFAAVLRSFLRVVIGFLISVGIGIILGTLMIHFKFSEHNLKPFILGIQTLPSVCWVPFAIIWFGLTEGAIIFVVVMGSAFSISLAFESGIKNVPPLYIKAAKTMGVTPKNLYQKVIFPAALPSFIAGLKQGWSFAWRALMSAEVMSASIGLGYTLMMGRDLADINQVMSIMLIIVILGILIDKGFFSTIEHHILRKRGLI